MNSKEALRRENRGKEVSPGVPGIFFVYQEACRQRNSLLERKLTENYEKWKNFRTYLGRKDKNITLQREKTALY